MSFIQIEKSQGVAVVRFARPRALNAFTADMYSDFANAIRVLGNQEDVRTILLTGEGTDFCAGNDINSFVLNGTIEPDVLSDRSRTPSTDLVHLLAELDKPLVACVQGKAIGFGATMLLHCDFVIADETTCLNYPFVGIGIVPEAGSTQLLEERVGRLNARRVLMLGEPVSALEALRLGLVSEIVPSGTAEKHGMLTAASLAKKPIGALRASKRLLNRPVEPLSSRVTAEFRELANCLASPETQGLMKGILAR